MKQYRRVRKLGQGSFGDVVLVERLADQTLLAQKRITLHRPENTAQVMNEVKVMQLLLHPNIIKYHEYTQSYGRFLIYMEYADDGDLLQVVSKAKAAGTPLPARTLLAYFAQLALAVKYLHDHRILHRDIKSQNIFLCKTGLIKLGDFGIAKQLESTDALAETSLGTPYYVSPEICQGKTYSYKSDVWMMGCVLYELCQLQKPFQGTSIHNVVHKIVNETPEIQDYDYAQSLLYLVRSCLTKDPALRPSVDEVLAHKDVQESICLLRETHPVYQSLMIPPPAPSGLKQPAPLSHAQHPQQMSFAEFLMQSNQNLQSTTQQMTNDSRLLLEGPFPISPEKRKCVISQADHFKEKAQYARSCPNKEEHHQELSADRGYTSHPPGVPASHDSLHDLLSTSNGQLLPYQLFRPILSPVHPIQVTLHGQLLDLPPPIPVPPLVITTPMLSLLLCPSEQVKPSPKLQKQRSKSDIEQDLETLTKPTQLKRQRLVGKGRPPTAECHAEMLHLIKKKQPTFFQLDLPKKQTQYLQALNSCDSNSQGNRSQEERPSDGLFVQTNNIKIEDHLVEPTMAKQFSSSLKNGWYKAEKDTPPETDDILISFKQKRKHRNYALADQQNNSSFVQDGSKALFQNEQNTGPVQESTFKRSQNISSWLQKNLLKNQQEQPSGLLTKSGFISQPPKTRSFSSQMSIPVKRVAKEGKPVKGFEQYYQQVNIRDKAGQMYLSQQGRKDKGESEGDTEREQSKEGEVQEQKSFNKHQIKKQIQLFISQNRPKEEGGRVQKEKNSFCQTMEMLQRQKRGEEGPRGGGSIRKSLFKDYLGNRLGVLRAQQVLSFAQKNQSILRQADSHKIVLSQLLGHKNQDCLSILKYLVLDETPQVAPP